MNLLRTTITIQLRLGALGEIVEETQNLVEGLMQHLKHPMKVQMSWITLFFETRGAGGGHVVDGDQQVRAYGVREVLVKVKRKWMKNNAL